MLRPRFLAVAALLVLPALVACAPPERDTVTSPDGRVQVGFALDDTGRPTWTVRHGDTEVLAPSPLGLRFAEGPAYEAGFTRLAARRTEATDQFEMIAGKASEARATYREVAIDLALDGQTPALTVVLRAYNDGVALRYKVPTPPGPDGWALTSETTRFVLPADRQAWALTLPSYTTSYENNYTVRALSAFPPDSLLGLPLVLQAPSGHTMAITEAHLTDYAGLYLRRTDDDSLALRADLSPHPDAPGHVVLGTGPLTTPWRTILLADDALDLIASNLVLHLNPPAEGDWSWVEPGTTAWDWWSGPVVEDPSIEAGMNMPTFQYYVDFASELGFDYVLVDAGWSGAFDDPDQDITRAIPEMDIPALVEYAYDRGVEIWLWTRWDATQRQMAEALPLYHAWGVRGIKVDYMDRDDQEMVAFYDELLAATAEHQLMLNLHGAYKPTGQMRTWPHFLTQEGVLGLEYVKWSDRANAAHNVVLPFTRGLAGPMDYTPGGFESRRYDAFSPRFIDPVVLGTQAHQLALMVVMESPLLCVADHPSAVRAAPGRPFVEAVPATWDETRPLAGILGDHVVLARRSGDDWYLGALTGTEARTVDLPLNFLDPRASYEATLYLDGEDADQDPNQVTTETRTVTATDRLTLSLAAGGGAAVRIAMQ
ncbi:MAG: glycoside hydrolase family 97 protein [Bacteroidota bacterium]